MFGYTLIKDKELERLQRIERFHSNAYQANRWLSEFDWFLGPMWNFIFSKEESWICEDGIKMHFLVDGSIDTVRDYMRKKIENQKSEG